jgi:ferredoxin
MIITKQKEFSEILKNLGSGPVFIVGCSECATICHTGGKEEVKKIKDDLRKNKIETTGSIILEPACHFLNDKRLLKNYKKEIEKAKKVLVLACGNGTQTVTEIIKDIDIIPGTDTLFLGEIKRLTDFEKRCIMCGECIQDLFEGICPIARCPKSMLNGPCGGSIKGKCEINSELDCVWDIIFQKLKEKGQLHKLKEIKKPKDWSKSTEIRRLL